MGDMAAVVSLFSVGDLASATSDPGDGFATGSLLKAAGEVTPPPLLLSGCF